ncbi:hypothetical protein AB0A69_06730 [Streptomyces sp. NPDC045431]|uniref:hypothetical protein n=1 Tax=Streptomyces sp. NPDC045431 TaxID=3155613 RepID=UPI0033D957F4
MEAPDGRFARPKAVDPDYLMSFPGPKGLVTNGPEDAGADGDWQSTKVAPPGVEAVRKRENVGFGMTETPNGRIIGAVADDGTAYGMAGDDAPLTPVSVSTATPLPEATITPKAMANGAGAFVTHAGTDSMRLIVLKLKS